MSKNLTNSAPRFFEIALEVAKTTSIKHLQRLCIPKLHQRRFLPGGSARPGLPLHGSGPQGWQECS